MVLRGLVEGFSCVYSTIVIGGENFFLYLKIEWEEIES